MDKQTARMFLVTFQIRLLLLLFIALPFLLIGYFIVSAPLGTVLGIWAGFAAVLMTLGVINSTEDWRGMIMFSVGLISILIFMGIIF